MRRKLRRLASSSRNARATVQGSDGRLLLCVPVILHLRRPSRAARCVRAVAAHLQKKCAGALSRAPNLWLEKFSFVSPDRT